MTEKDFKSCIMPLYPKMYGYALTILKNENDAADCMQDSFTKLWENRNRLLTIENKSAYCLVTIKRTALDMIRKQSSCMTEELESIEIVSNDATPEQSVEKQDRIRIINEIITTFPPQQRNVLRMSAFDGMSNTEIKEATGLSDDNVRVILSRTRKKLREIISAIK